MDSKLFAKAGLLVLVLLVTFLVIWELLWRSKGFDTSFDDNASLWADKRGRVYQPQDRSTVFIGSSRIKFDLDISTWKKLTGEEAVQLAIVGSSPHMLLQDLANDEDFKGKLVIDITEPLYFSVAPPYAAKPMEYVDYYQKISPSQKFSFKVSSFLERRLAFLDQEYLSINGLLNQMPLPERPQVFLFPYFPHEFAITDFSRQTRMMNEFVSDTSLQWKMKRNWLMLFETAKKFPPPPPQAVENIFISTKDAVAKIIARGGKVLFVRTPASNPMWDGEDKGFPREQYWEKLLKLTQSPGIHFNDYTETSSFVCPEWSHLSPADAIKYTTSLVSQMQQKGWSFAYAANK